MIRHHDQSKKKQVLSEGQEIAIKELIRKTIQQMDAEGFWNHSHEDEGEEVEAKP